MASLLKARMAREFLSRGWPERYAKNADDSINSLIAAAVAETDTEPTDGQRESGNYRKGKFRLHGLTIAIENPAGSVRSGLSADGIRWKVKMPFHYGYILRTVSEADSDHIDVFVGKEPESELVFVVDQKNQEGRFDEHKVMMGFASEEEAKQAYLDSYSEGWTGFQAITPMTLPQFKAWLENGDTRGPVACRAVKYQRDSLRELFSREFNRRGYQTKNRLAEQFALGFAGRFPERYGKWEESKHPRAADGKFGSGAGAQPAGEQPEQPQPPQASAPQPEAEQPKPTAATPAAPSQAAHPALQNLFAEHERELPADVIHHYRDKDSAYQAANQTLHPYRELMDMGKGVVAKIKGTTRMIDSKEAFNSMLNDFESGASKGPEIILAPLKGEERAAEKVANKYGGDWGMMNDLVRGTVAVDSLQELQGTIEAVRSEMESRGWKLMTRPNDRFTKPTAAGYRDVQLTLQAPNGLACELQINTKAMIVAKEKYGHKMYEEYRSLDESVKAAGRVPTAEEQTKLTALENQMSALYNDAWKKSGGH